VQFSRTDSLVVRRKSPHSWFLCSGVDLFIVVFLAVITIVAQVLGEYFIDLYVLCTVGDG